MNVSVKKMEPFGQMDETTIVAINNLPACLMLPHSFFIYSTYIVEMSLPTSPLGYLPSCFLNKECIMSGLHQRMQEELAIRGLATISHFQALDALYRSYTRALALPRSF
jgi:hypothetical protein